MSQTYQEMEHRRAEFAVKLQELMGEFRDVIGPQIDPITEEPCEHDRDETCPCSLPVSAMVNEWVMISSWTDVSKKRGEGEWSHLSSTPGMTKSHQRGLLFTHLYPI